MPHLLNVKDKTLLMDIFRLKALSKSNRIFYKKEQIKEQIASFLGIQLSELETFDLNSFFSDKSYLEKIEINKKAIDFYEQVGFNIHNLLLISKIRAKDVKKITKNEINIPLNDYLLGYPYLFNTPLIYSFTNIESFNQNSVYLLMQDFVRRHSNIMAIEAIDNMFTLSPDSYLSFVKHQDTPELKAVLRRVKASREDSSFESIKNSYFYYLLKLSNEYHKKEKTLGEISTEVLYYIHKQQ